MLRMDNTDGYTQGELDMLNYRIGLEAQRFLVRFPDGEDRDLMDEITARVLAHYDSEREEAR